MIHTDANDTRLLEGPADGGLLRGGKELEASDECGVRVPDSPHSVQVKCSVDINHSLHSHSQT